MLFNGALKASLCAVTIQLGSAAASRNSAGSGSPGRHSCTGPWSTAYATHKTLVVLSAAYLAGPTFFRSAWLRVSMSRCRTCSAVMPIGTTTR